MADQKMRFSDFQIDIKADYDYIQFNKLCSGVQWKLELSDMSQTVFETTKIAPQHSHSSIIEQNSDSDSSLYIELEAK